MYRDGKLEATVAIALMRAIGGPSKDLDRESILAGESLVGAILGDIFLEYDVPGFGAAASFQLSGGLMF